LDFSKAFDSIRHATLIDKFSAIGVQDNLYNWLIDYLTDHKHRTKYQSSISSIESINSSVIQGSAIGPTAFCIAACDLKTIHSTNSLLKYADDTYLIIPKSNIGSTSDEMCNVRNWSKVNNLALNEKKSQEMLITRKCYKGSLPDPLNGIIRVTELKVLGVVFTNKMSMNTHISHTINKCTSYIYALKLFRSHGMNMNCIHSVFNALVLSRLLYTCQAWWGFCNAEESKRIISFVRRAIKFGFCSPSTNIQELISSYDNRLFTKILKDPHHVLHKFLPPIQQHNHRLRLRSHDRTMPVVTIYNQHCYITRMLHKKLD